VRIFTAGLFNLDCIVRNFRAGLFTVDCILRRFRAGLFNVDCSVRNFCQMYFACGQDRIQNSEGTSVRKSCVLFYLFICTYILCDKNYTYKYYKREHLLKSAIHNLGFFSFQMYPRATWHFVAGDMLLASAELCGRALECTLPSVLRFFKWRRPLRLFQ
jgi:hypothetical protein